MSAYNLPDPATGSVQSNGVLAKWIKQTVDNTPSETASGEIEYRERWKGPYSAGSHPGKSILSRTKVNDTLDQVHTALGTYVQEFAAPACPTRNGNAGTWRLKSISIDQLDAGDHCYLNMTFGATFVTQQGSQSVLSEDTARNTWSVSWQAYSVAPWNFCSNGDTQPQDWTPDYDDNPPTPDWTKPANRALIETAMGQSPEFKGQETEFIVYTPDKNVPDVRKYLHPANMAIQKKVSLDRNAVYHYPIVRHQTSYYGRLGQDYNIATLGQNIDHIVELPNDCPYIFDETWDWLKIGDDMSMTKKQFESGLSASQLSSIGEVQYTRNEVFQGVLKGKWDVNYYGNSTFNHTKDGILSGRWELESI